MYYVCVCIYMYSHMYMFREASRGPSKVCQSTQRAGGTSGHREVPVGGPQYAHFPAETPSLGAKSSESQTGLLRVLSQSDSAAELSESELYGLQEDSKEAR